MADLYQRLVQWGLKQDALPHSRTSSRVPLSEDERPLPLAEAIRKGRPLLDALSDRLERPSDEDAGYEKKKKKFAGHYDPQQIAENKFTTGDYRHKTGKEHVNELVKLSGGAFQHERMTRVHTKAREQILGNVIISEVCIDARGGLFVGIQSYGLHDKNADYQKLMNSDLLYWQWAHVAEKRGTAVDMMKQYLSYAITNACTIAVIEDCLGEKREPGRQAVYSKGSNELAALARTPVGKRIPRLLHDYTAHLGCKDIKSATVQFSKFLNTWVILWSPEGPKKGKESKK